MTKIDLAAVMAGVVALATAALMSPFVLLGMTSKTAIKAFGLPPIDPLRDPRHQVREG